MGRPPKGEAAMMKPITIRLPESMRDAIDAYRADRVDGPDFATATRELIAEGLRAKPKRAR